MKKVTKKLLVIMMSLSIVLSLSTSVLAFETEEPDITNFTQLRNNITSNDSISENLNNQEETVEHNIILQNSSKISTASNSVTITTFDDLKNQITAAADGVPVELNINQTIIITESVKVPKNANITLTGKGTLEFTEETQRKSLIAFVIEEDATMTIDGITIDAKNLKISDSGYNVGAIENHGTLLLNSGIITGFDIIAGMNSGIITVDGQNAYFEMNGGSIEGNTFKKATQTQYTGVVHVTQGATFVMNGGYIQNNDFSDTMNSGIVYVRPYYGNSSFVMNNGTITNNKVYDGSIYIGSVQPDYQHVATFEMNGGTISHNTASYGAGGVFVFMNAEAVMNDGLILGNTGVNGGGVGVVDGFVPSGAMDAGFDIDEWGTIYHVPGAFTMNGGTITQNTALESGVQGGVGGGIYIASNKVTLNNGEITDNHAELQGGGVYVACVPYVLHMYNAVITENTASVLGGGIWSCPTGDVTIHVNNGGAVFDNTAFQNAAGDDFVSVPRSENYITTLSERMLGGGKADYYTDGQVLENSGVLGQPDPSVPRFDSTNPGSPITDITNSTDSYALKVITNDDAKQLANEKASLFITGNQSERGGGIGTNGSVVIGTEDNWKLHVTKEWNQVPESNYQDKEISVRLKIGDYELDAITLNQENNWTGSFTHLPNPDTLQGKEITVIEEDSEYNVSYSEIVRDDDTKTLYLTVTNTLKTGNLTVSKTVFGEHADSEQNFAFTVTLSDTSVNGIYGDIEFINGTATFTLKHGESKTAYGLPAGIQYQVTEQETQGYTLSAVGDTGTVPADGTAVAEFTNTKVNDTIPTDTPDSPEQGQMDSPKTGDSSNILFLLLPLAILSVAIAAILFINKQAHKN